MHFSNHIIREQHWKKNWKHCYVLRCVQWMLAKFIWRLIFFFFYLKVYLRKKAHIFNIDPDVTSIAARLKLCVILRSIFLWQSGKAGFQVSVRFCFLIKLNLSLVDDCCFDGWKFAILFVFFHCVRYLWFLKKNSSLFLEIKFTYTWPVSIYASFVETCKSKDISEYI